MTDFEKAIEQIREALDVLSKGGATVSAIHHLATCSAEDIRDVVVGPMPEWEAAGLALATLLMARSPFPDEVSDRISSEEFRDDVLEDYRNIDDDLSAASLRGQLTASIESMQAILRGFDDIDAA